MTKSYFALLLLLPLFSQAQEHVGGPLYHGSPDRENDLVHTKLQVSFDFNRSRMNGDARITLKPHFYPTDSLRLDAKGMEILSVTMDAPGAKALTYQYDSMYLRIRLPRSYTRREAYTVRVRYVARPDEYKARSYGLMAGEKGLYFINPRGAIKGKPTQVWTQGETEANSFWVPTIDRPNQKTTNEISMTVPAKYQTLSNGLLTSSKLTGNGMRTDTWKMSQPHAPYLLFMGVGSFEVVKDRYKGKDVTYYVEKEYAPVARRIFGYTPEMMALYSRLTGVEFPWPKYAQIVGRDYIFGAMENTTATLHGDDANQDARSLVDGNEWELVIAHELFHQWTGDYVTTESWSNTTVNESFADYSEALWYEYKYGREAMQHQLYSDRRLYLSNKSLNSKKLVTFNYGNAFEMFDQVSYQKGGCILQMLRSFVGDSAFFRSIKLYLDTYKYKSAEAQQLRLAFEEVTGKDLNWFWNQWYYGSGHPVLDLSYQFDAATRKARLIVQQTQDGAPFTAPVVVAVHQGGKVKEHRVWIRNRTDTFSFDASARPDLINFDAENVLVAQKTDHKTPAEWQYLYGHGSYIDRREAIAYFLAARGEPLRFPFLQSALRDPNKELRRYLLQNIPLGNDTFRVQVEQQLAEMAVSDPHPLVRADALTGLGSFSFDKYKPLYLRMLNDSSYSIAGTALRALAEKDSVGALAEARKLAQHSARKILAAAINDIFSKWGTEAEYAYLYRQFELASPNGRFNMLDAFATALARDPNEARVRQQVDALVGFRDGLPDFVRTFVDGWINGTLGKLADARKNDSALPGYIRSLVPPTTEATR